MSGGRKRRTRRPAGGAMHWVMLEHYLVDCAAWRDLSANARVVYFDIKRRYNGKNNGTIRFSAREAMQTLNAKSSDTGARALIELVDHGFIVVTEDSSFTRKHQIARSYRLTEAANDLPLAPGESRVATKEFLKWPARKQNPVRPIEHDSPTHRTRSVEVA